MKIEIEISDDDVKRNVEKYINSNLAGKGVGYGFKLMLDEVTREAIKRSFLETDFSHLIQERCHDLAIIEIEKAAAQKVPGWVKQQMKEMLKYARTQFWNKE
jgi:hypothetical protein